MGGLGKTTLAQLVYNEAVLKSYFEKVIWVSVSDYFDQTRIAKDIIRGAPDHVPEYLSEWNDDLHKRLCESVKKKRFLLVLDDMWTDSPEDVKKWELFRVAFKYAAQGSNLVTTRKKSVAEKIHSKYSHPLGVLSKEKCWELFSYLAFHLQGKNANKKDIRVWKETGIAIAERCKGVPLSAKILGNLLRQKYKIQDWKKVMDNKSIWDLENGEDGILKPALLMSYSDLPPPVRACFVYCAIFPKGHQIHKDALIGMWMAQDLKSSVGCRRRGEEKHKFSEQTRKPSSISDFRTVIQRQFKAELRLSPFSACNERRKIDFSSVFQDKSAPDTEGLGFASPRYATSNTTTAFSVEVFYSFSEKKR
ncbi:putative disease resistance protein RGA3 [Papaver somniferum]|uniref:putative disease resistance protein RGA3 n=1 Tax=Papaver somniferum TaxID=3469 RepID=UPI000E6FF23B|nr:putative disease resistance protein RGA3 [Papaver somniferum]